MTVTRLSDAVKPAIYASYQTVDDPELSAFFQSGIAVRNEALGQRFAGGGDTVNIPFWMDLDQTSEPNYSTDDPASNATPENVGSDKMVARMAYLNKGFGQADLVREIAGSNPMQRIRSRFRAYWVRQFQRRILAATEGLFADNVANDGGDMVNDITAAGGTNGDVGSANLFSLGAFTGAAFTLGDHFDMISSIAMHSVVYKRVVDNNEAEDVRDSEGNLLYQTYKQARIIVDDLVTHTPAGGTASGDSAPVYWSYLFAPGFIAYDDIDPLVPVEVHREPTAGDGGGVESLWERTNWVLHPFGFAWQEATVNGGNSPNLADLKLATNWDRVVDRKNVPVAAIKSNG